MIGQLAVVCLLVAAPAFAQTRVYTNADLGKPLTWTHTPTPEELASLAAHQFVALPVIPDGPVVLVIGGDPSQGPFGPFDLSSTQPLDPNWRGDGWGYWGPGLGSWFVPTSRFDRFDHRAHEIGGGRRFGRGIHPEAANRVSPGNAPRGSREAGSARSPGPVEPATVRGAVAALPRRVR